MASNTPAGREHNPTTEVAVAPAISSTHTTYAPVGVDRDQDRDIYDGTVTPIHSTVGGQGQVPLPTWWVGHKNLVKNWGSRKVFSTLENLSPPWAVVTVFALIACIQQRDRSVALAKTPSHLPHLFR